MSSLTVSVAGRLYLIARLEFQVSDVPIAGQLRIPNSECHVVVVAIVAKVGYFTDILLSAVTVPATLGCLLFFACVCSRLAVVRRIATLFWIPDSCAMLLPERHLFRLCLFTPRGCPAYRDFRIPDSCAMLLLERHLFRQWRFFSFQAELVVAVVWALRAMWVPLYRRYTRVCGCLCVCVCVCVCVCARTLLE